MKNKGIVICCCNLAGAQCDFCPKYKKLRPAKCFRVGPWKRVV